MVSFKDNITLEPTSIKRLLSWVWTNDKEICGKLGMNEDIYYIDDNKDNINEGQTETYGDGRQREGCVIPHPRGHMFFHTHPMGSKSYPSYEDIISVAKMFYDKSEKPISIIGTRWGIWMIRKRKSHQALDREYSHHFHDDYVKAAKVLYKHALYDIDEGMEEHIQTFCKHMSKILEDFCQITFSRWPLKEIKEMLLGKKKKSIKKSKKRSNKKKSTNKKKNKKKSIKSYNKAKKRNA